MARRFLGRLAVSCHKLKLTGHTTRNGLEWAGRPHSSSHRAGVDALDHGTELSLDAGPDTRHAAPAYDAEQAATRRL